MGCPGGSAPVARDPASRRVATASPCLPTRSGQAPVSISSDDVKKKEAEPDDDDEAESDDVRQRLEKLEAMEHGEVDWDDDDVYSLGQGQSWSSVDHLA